MLSAKTVLLNRAEHISLVFDVGRGPSAFGDCCWRTASHPPTFRGDAGSDRAAAGADGNRGRRPCRQRNVSSEGWEEERCCKGGLESGTISAAVLRIADGDGLD